jgi:hypothetical protein
MTGRRVRQRRQPPMPRPPAHLARFDPGDWHGDAETAARDWWAAREDWLLFGGYLDAGPLGSPLDRMVARREARLSALSA